jgi:hypothetical protein
VTAAGAGGRQTRGRHGFRPSGLCFSPRPFYFLALLAVGGCSLVGPRPVDQLRIDVQSDARFSVGENHVRFEAFSQTLSRSLIVYLEAQAPSGRRRRTEARWRLPPGRANILDIAFGANETGVYSGQMRIYDEERARLLFVDNELRFRVWPRYEFLQDRSYYTDEDQASFRLRDHQGDSDSIRIVRVELVGEGGSSHEQRQMTLRGKEVFGEIPIATLPAGRYQLTARIYGGEGPEDSVSVAFDKLAPAEQEVKIDRFNGTLLKNGEPFFPVGLYWLRSEMLSQARRLKFNSGDYYYRLEPEEIAQLMEDAAGENLGILLELSDFIRRREVPDQAGIDSVVTSYRAHPALLAWYLIDEPAETGVEPSVTRAIYERVKELDPYHPIYLVNNRPHLYEAHVAAADIIGIDPYPIPKYPITRVRDYVQEAYWSSRGQKPVWLVAQAFGGVEHWPRAPTPIELRNMVYQGLVQGAKGVFFYRFCQEQERHIQPAALWREVQALAAELHEVTPALVSPDWDDAGGFGLGELSAGAGVDVMLKQVDDGYFLFAVNITGDFRTVRLTGPGLPRFSEAEALYQAAEPRLVDGRLEANLAPLGVGVYRLKSSSI